MIQFQVNHPENKVKVGFLVVDNVKANKTSPLLESRFTEMLTKRSGQELSLNEDLLRLAARDMLRYKTYKPTGRAKPASEYLLRTAQEDKFPRINTLVDINNYISMKYVLPISLWDISKAESNHFLFRPGFEKEEYVFNPTGQTISVQDLMSGFRVVDEKEEPIVNPVKDSMLTKTDAQTSQIAISIYYPSNQDIATLNQALDEFEEMLIDAGGSVSQKEIM